MRQRARTTILLRTVDSSLLREAELESRMLTLEYRLSEMQQSRQFRELGQAEPPAPLPPLLGGPPQA